MDSTASIAKLTKRISDATIILFQNQYAKSVDFAEINHSYSARFGNLIYFIPSGKPNFWDNINVVRSGPLTQSGNKLVLPHDGCVPLAPLDEGGSLGPRVR
ncbi:hypothetical protein DVH24_000340 [Malus domestica]|uniref:Uncharacterized protein n=1 Tax=Malus domestica TaxID=3750 RepID=A0A498J5L5_MALDO|nr:hypothetical protein DVH24_000340 [Malus domestica]